MHLINFLCQEKVKRLEIAQQRNIFFILNVERMYNLFQLFLSFLDTENQLNSVP